VIFLYKSLSIVAPEANFPLFSPTRPYRKFNR
jgi:hypothetical protein